MKTTSKKIGEFFRKARLEAGMQTEQVAQCLNLASAELLLEYESGARNLPLDEVFALANIYNIAPDQVVAFFYELSLSSGSDQKNSGRLRS